MVQIDVKRLDANMAVCNLYTADRCVQIFMHVQDYKSLMRDGFFIRDGNEEDSAGVINTSKVFLPEIINQ